jgi:hypothetical protein
MHITIHGRLMKRSPINVVTVLREGRVGDYMTIVLKVFY